MQNYFSAKISQEHCDNVRNLALSFGISVQNIVFETDGCPLGSIGLHIKFESKNTLDKFSKSLKELYPCAVLEQW